MVKGIEFPTYWSNGYPLLLKIIIFYFFVRINQLGAKIDNEKYFKKVVFFVKLEGEKIFDRMMEGKNVWFIKE